MNGISLAGFNTETGRSTPSVPRTVIITSYGVIDSARTDDYANPGRRMTLCTTLGLAMGAGK